MAHRPPAGLVLALRAGNRGHRLLHQRGHHTETGGHGHRQQPLPHRPGDVVHRQPHAVWQRDRRVGLDRLVVLHRGGPLVCGSSWRTPDTYHSGRHQAGDRHLNFHDDRDNLHEPAGQRVQLPDQPACGRMLSFCTDPGGLATLVG